MKISAADFWRLLPIALERLDEHLRLELRIPLEMRIIRVTESGQRHPRPGEQIRFSIGSGAERHYPVTPMTTVLWLLTGDYVQARADKVAREVGMNIRFFRSVGYATWQVPGFSRSVRKKLLTACKLDPQYLEPTTA